MKQHDDSFADISAASPGLRLVSRSLYAGLPGVGIHGEFVRNRTHVRFILWEEVVHKPAIVEERPLNARRLLKNLAERRSRRTVDSRMQWEVVNVAGVLRSDETLAVPGSFARRQIRAMDVNEAFICAVVERYEGACIRRV